MKIKELIEELEKLDGERLVVLSSDEEGNYYQPMTAISQNTLYNHEDKSINLETLTPELREKGYTEEDLGTGEKAIVLYP